MKYVIYLRVSTKKQDLRTQMDLCLKHIKSKDGREFNYVVKTDEVTSRKPLERRQGIQDALNCLDKGDILVALKIDRLARNAHEASTIKHILEQKKADFIIVQQPGVNNILLFSIYAAMAEEEGNLIRSRISDKMQAKKARNELTSFKAPYGYCVDPNGLVETRKSTGSPVLKPGILVPCPHEQIVLNYMIELHAQGLTYRAIAQHLQARGYKNRSGNDFLHDSVYRILSRKGLSRPRGRPQTESVFQMFHSA